MNCVWTHLKGIDGWLSSCDAHEVYPELLVFFKVCPWCGNPLEKVITELPPVTDSFDYY